MAFTLKPFRELIAMSEEKLSEAMAPLRAASTKKKAELKVLEIDEKILSLQKQVQDLAVKKEIDFDAMCDKLDDIAILEQRQSRLREIVGQLFPEGA